GTDPGGGPQRRARAPAITNRATPRSQLRRRTSSTRSTNTSTSFASPAAERWTASDPDTFMSRSRGPAVAGRVLPAAFPIPRASNASGARPAARLHPNLMGRPRRGGVTARSALGLLEDGLDLEVELDLVADDHATGFHHGVEGDAEVAAPDLARG